MGTTGSFCWGVQKLYGERKPRRRERVPKGPACVLDSTFIGKFGALSRCWLINHQALNLHIVDEKPTTPSFCPIGTVLATAQIEAPAHSTLFTGLCVPSLNSAFHNSLGLPNECGWGSVTTKLIV